MSSDTFWIVVPCYNEGNRFPINEFQSFISDQAEANRFLFVNDGSTDNTAEILSDLNRQFPEKTTFLDLKENKGKAGAIREGMLSLIAGEKDFEYAGFMDADLSTPLSEITHLRKTIDETGKRSMIIGSRIKLFGSTHIERSEFRHYIGRVIATFISASLELPVYETQCGFKFFRRDRVEELFKEEFSSRWLFDVELIFRLLILLGYDTIADELYEMPVKTWIEKGDSKIPLSYAFNIPLELMKIRMRYKKQISS